MSLSFHLFLLIGLLFLACFFSSTETALFSLSRIERNRLKKNHPKLSKWVFQHLDHPRQALTSILIGNLVVHILATSIVTLLALEFWGPQGTGVALVVFTVFLIFFGEMVPKIIAVRKNEWIALLGALPLLFFSWIIFPFRKMTRLVSDWVLSHVIKERIESVETISEEELKAFVKVGEEEGILDREERRMIQKIFDLGEKQVRAIMTPRIHVHGIDLDDPIEKHMALIRDYHHAQFPVCKTSLDNILGVIPAQDYVLNRDESLTTMLKQPIFVPETKRIDDLLAQFREQKIDFAVCVDEFGGTAGIVTLEDILEEVFGEFYDEYAKIGTPVRPYGFQEYLVEAKMPLADFNERFALKLEAKEATTLGGLILEQFEEVPERGRTLKLEGCELKVHEVIRQRYIRSVIVRIQS